MTDSDDVEVRCKGCGARMGSATVRSASAFALRKMRWILTRLNCEKCDRGVRSESSALEGWQ